VRFSYHCLDDILIFSKVYVSCLKATHQNSILKIVTVFWRATISFAADKNDNAILKPNVLIPVLKSSAVKSCILRFTDGKHLGLKTKTYFRRMVKAVLNITE